MPVPKLIFSPSETDKKVSYPQLIQTLTDSQFIEPDANKKNQYYAGNKFLNLITFLGCSPNINLSPADGEDHCIISLIEQTTATKCLGYTQTANPKCPACTKRISNWKTADWQKPDSFCVCDKCQTQTRYADLNWKHECGFGRCGFEISHIYPHEAVPTDQLLSALKQLCEFAWQYCYADN